MKKIWHCIVAVIFVSFLCASCTPKTSRTQDKLRVVCTIFPAYDWVKNVMGVHVADTDLTLLMDSGVDPHSFQPSAEDVIKIATADIFVYVGGESDGWVHDALENATNKNMDAINLLEVLGANAKAEEAVEGMQEEEHHHHDEGEEHHDDDTEHHHEEAEEHHHAETEYDEHVWLSLRNARIFCSHIAAVLVQVDNDHAAVYKTNAEQYDRKLASLDSEYQTTVLSAKNKTVLFADRFPFRYLVDDYGISYFAAFPGCSAETEASFETVIFLARKLDELQLSTVLTIEGTQHKIAQTIVQNTKEKNQRLLIMDSMQNVTSKETAAGVTYLSIMEKNLTILKSALN